MRSRGEYPGEAGADWSFGATAKPEADEHYGRGKSAGLSGEDKRQGDLRDQTSNLREPLRGEAAETQRSSHQAAQHGADVRGIPPTVQGTNREDSLPEGLRRERKGPYDKNVGRKEVTRVPGKWETVIADNPKAEKSLMEGPARTRRTTKARRRDRELRLMNAGRSSP